ncbi:YveK family protein [Sinosporangium siamense]|uniref:Polysaccharide chain length determinant N-terminal domain-containing protein n=1 Tax=Sinosporangium siamense TaxID=1367973 RepID=A0A919RG36_9ACTN|nr:Wzz/FepE/Etk N-terminal domain-containing protein [Sinosporangium siamense]GII93261.1 hypothetical protein Ssi02_34920 [Sinosporangium siamense]
MRLPQDIATRTSSDALSDCLGLLRRRWAILLLCLAAGFTGGVAITRFATPAFTATAQVLVTPTGVQDQFNQLSNRQREPLNLDTESQIAQSTVVTEQAMRTLGTAGHASEPPLIDVSVPPNSAVLSISATTPWPETAAAQANAFAQAYLSHRAATATETLNAQLKALMSKRRQVLGSLARGATALADIPRGSAEHSLATGEQATRSRQLRAVTLRYDELKTVVVTPGKLIGGASVPEAPSFPSLPLNLGSGLMIGLLTGAAAATLRDRLDTRLRSAADVERLTSLPVLTSFTGRPGPSPDILGAGPVSGALAGFPAGPMSELASWLVAACPSGHILLYTPPRAPAPAPLVDSLAEALGRSAPLSVLGGSDVGDLARADAAVLLVTQHVTRSTDVTAATRHLTRHKVTVIGTVLIGADLLASRPPVRTSRAATDWARPVHHNEKIPKARV